MSIVFINSNKELFYCQDNRCQPLDRSIKHEPVVGILDPKKVITHSFKVPLNISKDELDIEVEMKLYDEAGLNAADEYKIDYIVKEKNIEETENMVEAFAVKVSDLNQQFDDLLPKVKHIDLLTVPYVSYQGLYERKILEPKNDVFLELGKDNSFIVLCSGGKYIYARPISDLNILSSGIDNDFELDVNSYIKLLQTKGVDERAYGEDEKDLFEIVQSQFQAIYNRINDTVMYNRNIFGFEKADRIFVDCQNGWIRGFDTFLHEMMFESAQVLSLRESVNLQWSDFNTTDTIVAEYAMLHTDINPNLTTFTRKTPFSKSFLAKILYSAMAASLLVSVYPLYLIYAQIQLNDKIQTTNETLVSKQASQTALAKDVKSLNDEIKQIEKDIVKVNNSKSALIEKVDKYLQLNSNNASDLKFIKVSTKLMKKYDLNSKDMGKNESEYFVSIYTNYSSRDAVTKFMHDLLKVGYKNVETDKIYIEEDNRYNCTVKIAL